MSVGANAELERISTQTSDISPLYDEALLGFLGVLAGRLARIEAEREKVLAQRRNIMVRARRARFTQESIAEAAGIGAARVAQILGG